ncbi:MAG: hypothetical protein RJA22_1512 [Verrucomicrobiota bacterium]
MGRTIVHLDADAFFASVEQAADPRLRGRPVAVGGERRGIIASASYEARRFGIFTPMPTARARKLCPRLIVLPGDFDKYEHFSRWMFSYAQDFTPDVEIASIDEGYFDLTGVRRPAVDVAEAVRAAIRQSLKITVSEGIGTNKLVSQIASKLNKPAAFTHVPPGREVTFLHPLPNRWLPGVGPQASRRLDAAGLARIGHVAATPPDLLALLLGGQAEGIRRFAQGLDDRPLVPVREPQKTFSQQETFAADLTDEDYAAATLRRMADQLFAKVREEGRTIRTLTVRIRYGDMDEAQVSESLAEPTDLETDVYGRLHGMLRAAWRRRVSLRLVSLKLSNLYDRRFRSELELDGPSRSRAARTQLAAAVDELRRTRGRTVILRGHDFRLREAPYEPVAADVSPLKAEGGAGDSRRTSAATGVAADVSPLKAEGEAGDSRRTSAATGADYVPLRVRSHFSFLDSVLSPAAIVRLAREHGMSAVALTDVGNLHGAAEFAAAARDAGVRPIFGVELSVGDDPLLLYVESARGYHHLCRLLSRQAERTAAEGDESSVAARQRLPWRRADLEGLTEGLVAVGGDERLGELFPGRFYRLATARDRGERGARAGGAPRVVAPLAQHATAADAGRLDIVQSIRTLTLLGQAHPGKRAGGRRHFRTPAEMGAACRAEPGWLRAGREIADRCRFEFPFGRPQFPEFCPPDGTSPRVFLARLVREGLRRRYGARAARHAAQVEEELGIIAAVGYEAYFLLVWELLQECRAAGIDWITRGSAADSLVCYCLGISDVCPIRFELYFKRFLNPERMALNKLPDIDIDFPHDRKDDVVRLLFARHGPERCAMVGGFSTFQARSAFAEVAKVLGVAEREVRKFTEHFPWSFGGGWTPDEPGASAGARLIELLRAGPETRGLPLDEEPYRTALETAAFLDGVPRYPKMHPCGVVLSGQPMRELTPTFVSNKGLATTHYDMDAVEAMGLVKMDILAQGGLAVMRDARASLARRGVTVDLGALEPWDDPEVWRMIAGGGARAVHHIESPAMTALNRMTNVREIDGLIAIVSVIRPGAANESKKLSFTRRYQGMEPVMYPDPSLEPCLRSTFGLVVYEEHILQICEAFAGLPGGRADVLRRALVKRRRDVVEEMGREFAASARARGHDEGRIAEVWQLVTGFDGYAFNKAHSTAYGVEAYQAAWLKRHHPAEFMAAVLTSAKGFYHPLVYVLECHRLGLGLLPPSVNEPGPDFVPHGNRIRVPLTRAKGLSGRTAERMVAARREGPFASLADFYHRVVPAGAELEILVRAGGMDEFGEARTRQFWQAQHLAQAGAGGADPAQGWLLPPPGLGQFPGVPLEEPTRLARLEAETDLFGFAVTGHPLELFPDVAWETYCPVRELGGFVGREVTTCGLVVEQRIHHQATGEPMKFLTLADWTGLVETELFAATYRSHGLASVRYPVLEVTARVEPYENGRGFSLRVLHAGKPRGRG